jgi:hypothetical protein
MDGHVILSLFHILAVVPFFLYVGLQRAALPNEVYTSLWILGSIITVYHGYKALIKYRNASPSLWVNLIHVLIVGPLLIYIGAKGKDTPRPAYEMLLMVAFAAGGYHLYSLIQQMNNVKETN